MRREALLHALLVEFHAHGAACVVNNQFTVTSAESVNIYLRLSEAAAAAEASRCGGLAASRR
jgi:hypothetical protein